LRIQKRGVHLPQQNNETITAMHTQLEVTKEIRSDIFKSIILTQNLIDRENAYSEDLRKKDVVEQYIAHLANLNQYLIDGYIPL
jgi:phage replication-related protein YjqB (UPF0714/DUF867 family)